MQDNDTKRLSRLTAIMVQLQSKRLLTATELAGKFSVSVRTIYRDIRTLEQAGIPILTEEGRGYTMMEGYLLPPVMFSEKEANALITAEQVILKNKDASFIKDYQDAIIKIRSVLRHNTKDKAELLSGRVLVASKSGSDYTSNYLSALQLALTNFSLIYISYQAADTDIPTERALEPFALLSTRDNWLLVAWCRLRKDFRSFRLDRIRHLNVSPERFEPHNITLQDYFDRYQEKNQTPLT